MAPHVRAAPGDAPRSGSPGSGCGCGRPALPATGAGAGTKGSSGFFPGPEPLRPPPPRAALGDPEAAWTRSGAGSRSNPAGIGQGRAVTSPCPPLPPSC